MCEVFLYGRKVLYELLLFNGLLVFEQGTAQRPEVRIVTWKNDELTTDALPVHGFEHYTAKDYSLAHAPFTGIVSLRYNYKIKLCCYEGIIIASLLARRK